MKRVLKAGGLVLLALLLLAIIIMYILFWNEINIMESVSVYETNDENTIYIMDYETDYHLDEVLEIGASTDSEIAAVLSTISSHGMYTAKREVTVNPGCEVISAADEEGNLVWGRNFDWADSVPIIVRCRPKDGYASISTCEFSNITQDASIAPTSAKSRLMVVSAIYVPMDGVNEKGLCVADVEVKEGGMEFIDTEKVNLTTVLAVRMLLNKAATVDEAIAMLEKYDIAPSGSASHHLAISDVTGRSVVVEFFGGQMTVTENNVLTNFGILNNGINTANVETKLRYEKMLNAYNYNNGVMSREDMTYALKDVAHDDEAWKTRWSMVYVYKPDRIEVDYYFNGNFEEKNTVELTLK